MSRVRDIANILSGGSSAIATDAEVTSATAYIPSNVAGKNFIINGGMDIAQRGNSFNGVQGYNLDRWFVNGYGTSTNYSVGQYLVSGVIPGIRYYQRIASTTTNTQNFWLSQSLETNEVIRFAGQTVTLSFYYRMPTNNFTGTWGVSTSYSTGTDANLHYPAASTTITADSIANTVYWTRFTKTFTVPISATSFNVTLSTTNNIVNAALFDITGVQLELGSVATPFSRAGGDLQGELAKCQRYYFRNSATGLYSTFAPSFPAQSTTAVDVIALLPVTMRVAPVTMDYSLISIVDNVTLYNTGTFALQANGTSANAATIRYTHPSAALTQYRPYFLCSSNSVSGYIGFSAEL